jgi:hypothetical protein
MNTQKQIEEIRLTMWRYILDKRNHEILQEYPYLGKIEPE